MARKPSANSAGFDGSSADHQFVTTQWSLVVTAGRRGEAQATEALSRLCEAYWQPLYAYARRKVIDRDEARDVTQAFFAELLAKNYVGAADADRGRFRAFLVTAFQHFLLKHWDRQRALKRGGGQRTLSLDFDAADSAAVLEPADHLTPEQIFDRAWAVTLLGQVMARLSQENTAQGKSAQWEVLREFLAGETPGMTYQQAAQKIGLTEAAARQAASRLRKRYRELLRQEIAHTVQTPGEIDDEIHNLFAVLSL